MMRMRRIPLLVLACALLLIQCAPIAAAASYLHMVVTLEKAKREGVYATPEEGMRARVTKSWISLESVEIQYAGPNARDGSNPHVWFVVAQVRAASRASGAAVSPRGYDSAGSFFVRVQDGWVHIPEGQLPELVGHLMRLFHYAG
jgi:hypothetical protein